jgi:Protein of unknown function (DUF2975)
MMKPNEPAPKSAAEAEMRLLAKRSALFALVAVAVAVTCAALLAALDLVRLFAPFMQAITTGDTGLLWRTVLDFIHSLVQLIPIGFYLTAVLGALRILDHISEGEYFSARNIRALSDMGGSMLWGAGWALFLVPALSDWTSGVGGYRVDFRPEPLVIATIGLCVLVLGRLLLRAQRLETEMEAIV